MTLTAYFDTNVYTQILDLEDGVTEAHVAELRRVVASGHVRVRGSGTNLEEMAGTVKTDPARARHLLQTFGTFTDRVRLVKSAQDLILDEMEAFAGGRPAPSPLCLPPPEYDTLVRGDVSDEDLDEVANEVKAFTEAMLESSIEAHEGVMKTVIADGLTAPLFEELLPGAGWITEALVEKAGLMDACVAHGLERLRKQRTFRLIEGSLMSLIYTRSFRPRKPKRGDAYDMQHAACATAARVFVTHDERLAEDLRRLHVPDFKVASLPELLAGL